MPPKPGPKGVLCGWPETLVKILKECTDAELTGNSSGQYFFEFQKMKRSLSKMEENTLMGFNNKAVVGSRKDRYKLNMQESSNTQKCANALLAMNVAYNATMKAKPAMFFVKGQTSSRFATSVYAPVQYFYVLR